MTSRRGFLAGLTALAAPSLGWGAVGDPVGLAAAQAPDGAHLLVGLTGAGDLAFQIPLPARGHAAAAHPTRAEAVAIARRPGTFAKVIDCGSGAVLKTLAAPKGRHFYGHGAFSADGHLLFTTENQFATGEGRIGVWDRSLGYRRIDEFPSSGIGPHEILRLSSVNLAVANGGIRTHPATGREKLNLESMHANLSVFSPSGQLLDQAQTPRTEHQNSLRHIAEGADGRVICGFQWQGDPYAAPQLLAFYRGAGQLTPSRLSEDALHGLNAYVGSVCALGPAHFAATSPRGGRVLITDHAGTLTAAFRAEDVCGLVATGSEVLATSGLGHILRLGPQGLATPSTHPLKFDNHITALR